MRLLILEDNESILNIYKKIFKEKNYEADFAKNELECLNKYNENFDYVVLENSKSSSVEPSLEYRIRELNPKQKIFYLFPYLNSKKGLSEVMQETREIIEKPFSIINLVAQMELKR